MKNRITLYLPILFALVLIIGILLGYKLTPVSTGNPKLFDLNLSRYDKLNDVVDYIVSEYVDSVSKEQLTENGINGILENLDPHSSYISAKEFHAVNDPLLGNFEGIGIQFRIISDTIVVIYPTPGGPSEKVGLLAGDRIVTVDDTLIAGIGLDSEGAMRKLKGKRGTEVKVGVYRKENTSVLDFVIRRDIIPTFSVDIAYMPEETIGYIKVSKFSATTYNEFLDAIDHLKTLGMDKLILDLRGNTGGYLQAAIDMADEFLVEDKLIVYTKGNNQPRESSYATNKGQLENNDIVILIDEGSASASEIVAGALQDNDRGTIVGRRSFGKGLVQRQLDFLDGSALRLTIARYYTPTGRCIQKPYDSEIGFDEYYHESVDRFYNGELVEADSSHLVDSLKYITPGGKVVYGGGGIMPDVFIPLEKNDSLVYFNKLNREEVIFRFAFSYVDNNRKKLGRFSSFEDFNENFSITPTILNELIALAEEKGIPKDEEGISFAKQKIEILLKAYIGRNLYDDEGFYPIYLTMDGAFKKSIETLKGDLVQ